jgi:hypothetical protein
MYGFHPARHDHTTEHEPFAAASDREYRELSKPALFDLGLIARLMTSWVELNRPRSKESFP